MKETVKTYSSSSRESEVAMRQGKSMSETASQSV